MERSDTATIRVITGYEVFRFGVPMIGEYTNTGRGRTVTISLAVPGAQYRITAWALDDGTRRSATPAVESVTTGGTSECRPLTPRSYIAPSLLLRPSLSTLQNHHHQGTYLLQGYLNLE